MEFLEKSWNSAIFSSTLEKTALFPVLLEFCGEKITNRLAKFLICNCFSCRLDYKTFLREFLQDFCSVSLEKVAATRRGFFSFCGVAAASKTFSSTVIGFT